ncbi:hypothetical protein Tco_0850333 [Tanacetum coccineum]
MAEHFGLLTTKIPGGLTVIVPELLVIDMVKLVRLQICEQFDDTWAWVAIGPERQPDVAAGALGVAQDTPVIDEGLSEGAHLQHFRDAPGRGLTRPTPPQHSRTHSSQTHDPSIKPGRPRERNIDEYWWRIYKSGDLEVLES